jgi:hypothetical protein
MDQNTLCLMRESLRSGLAHGATIREAAAEAGALGLGLAHEDDPVLIADVVVRLLREMDSMFPDLLPGEPDARQNRPTV